MKHLCRRTWFAGFLLALLSSFALAVEPDEVLPDPALEARARALSLELRCLVCQNQSIDDSNAPLARDLRVLVRERLSAGDSDADVRRYVVARYGSFVLLRPPFAWNTVLLWLTPLLAISLAAVALWRSFRRADASDASARALSPAEEAALERLCETERRAAAGGNHGPDRNRD